VQYKLAQEQIDQAKYEFDFNKGEMIQTTGDEFERVSSQEMYVRSSGREGQVVVPAQEANKAADAALIKQGGKEGTFERAKFKTKMRTNPEEIRRANAAQSRKDAAAGNRAKEILAKQEADVRKRGNKNLITTGLDVPGAVKGAAAAKIAQAAKKLGGKTNMLNIPIMTKGSADKIFKDFFGKQDYSS